MWSWLPTAAAPREIQTMTTTVSIDQAQAKLAEIIAGLSPGDEVIITQNQQPVAKLMIPLKRREPGRCKGMITLLVEDDEHLEAFKEYMP
jgi:antitoxin (DNA-binding transcriptional repressor) of toxin-antitoxin stability system